NKKIMWGSSDETIATVKSDGQQGQVTAKSVGEATITATSIDGNYQDTCTIYVAGDQVMVTGVSLNESYVNIDVDESFTLIATITPSNATNKDVSWSSSDSSIAQVNSGVIIGKSNGSSTITVTTVDQQFSADCRVVIGETSIRVTGVTLNQQSMRAYIGDTPRLTATISPSDANDQSVAWSSSNSNVATVDNGLISALSYGTTTITVTTIDGGFTDTCLLTVEQNEVLAETIIDSGAGFSYGSYDTNYGTDIYKNITYGFYRVDSDNDHSGMIKLFPSLSQYDYGALPGSFFNDSPISGIKQITVSYISTGGLTIAYGDTRTRNYSQTIASTGTSGWTTTTISLTISSCYFSIETNGQIAYLKSVRVGYNSSLTPNTDALENESYRIAPTVYSGSLVDGVSSVSVPDSISMNSNTYTVNSYRTYTYYSFDYVSANRSRLNLDNVAMTDPVDVANYYIAFHAIPANYGHGNTVNESCATISEVNSLFDDDARSITQYNRTTGYAQAVPWRAATGQSKPIYYEFDIALDSSYSTSNRSVGRLVMWVYGWSCYDDLAPVAVYTDDHYATFGEYLNYGCFGSRFDSQTSTDGYRTGICNHLGSTQLDG
ncbi:MAG TPA: Ig-like domain-containing protein, partial [Bacilli bacterium]|nr:Ig-like domain-containing protein [Bacilli bacterium]